MRNGKRNVPLKVRKEKNPCKKTFQAIRIEVNGELDELKKGMSEAFERLSAGGRLAIITFHSIEDRIVKIHSENIAQAVPVRRIFPFAYAERSREAERFTESR